MRCPRGRGRAPTAPAGRASARGGSSRPRSVEVSAWPMCSAPVTLGGGWVITKGGLRPVGAAARSVRGEDVGRKPALVDARLDLRRRIGRSASARLLCRACRRSPPCPPESKRPRSSSGRTGSWYHLLVQSPAVPRSSRGRFCRHSLLRANGRSRSAHGRRSRRRAWSGFQPSAGLLCSGRSGATPPGQLPWAPSVASPACAST